MSANVEALSSSPEPLRGSELDAALVDISNKVGISPEIVDSFMKVEVKGLPWVDKAVPVALLGGYVATWAINNGSPDLLPDMGTLPSAVHWTLQAIYNLSGDAAESPLVKEHLPFIFGLGAAGWGVVRTWIGGMRLKVKNSKIGAGQEEVTELIEAGEFPFSMEEGHSAIFSGSGDVYADLLQAVKPKGEVIQYGHERLDSEVWQKIQKEGRQEDLFDVLDRGDFSKAGEIVLLPVVEEDMFLPDKGGHDMTLDEMRSLVKVLDAYCEKRGVGKKRVIVVGRETMKETYTEMAADGKRSSASQTLAGSKDAPKGFIAPLNHEMQDERGVEVEVVDPTRLVMERINTLAEGKEIKLYGTESSIDRYGDRFRSALTDVGYEVTDQTDSVRVIYNISDVPTIVRADSDDIAVILDPNRKQGLIDLGIPEDRIIVVPELVFNRLSEEVEES